MLAIVATNRKERFASFQQGAEQDGTLTLSYASTGLSALELVRSKKPEMLIVDAELPDFKPLELVSEMLKVWAFTQAAVVDSMDEHEFHEESEGLGVLMQLDDPPSHENGVKLLQALSAVV